MYEIIGYAHRTGISKSKNKPYDLEILYCVTKPMTETKDTYGVECETVIIDRLRNPREPQYPVLGDKVRVYYSRNGYAEDYDII